MAEQSFPKKLVKGQGAHVHEINSCNDDIVQDAWGACIV